jgi:hypothetical protein
VGRIEEDRECQGEGEVVIEEIMESIFSLKLRPWVLNAITNVKENELTQDLHIDELYRFLEDLLSGDEYKRELDLVFRQ